MKPLKFALLVKFCILHATSIKVLQLFCDSFHGVLTVNIEYMILFHDKYFELLLNIKYNIFLVAN